MSEMQRTILIVEDSEDCAETLQIALESISGLSTTILRSSGEAKKALSLTGINVAALVTDLHLPSGDGFELIREFRSQPRFASLPVVMISGDSDPRLPTLALAHGADAFFSKPYSPAAVRRKLEQLLC